MKTLYVRTGCGFCAKVMAFVVDNKVQVEVKNIADGNNLEELVQLGGRRQVPFLIDKEKGISMYESGNIIDYLSNELSYTTSLV